MATTADGKSVPMTEDCMVKYDDWPLQINPKAHKLWAAEVTGYDSDTKYNWIQTFLESEKRDGDKHYDVSGLGIGDYVRVAAGSHRNDYTSVLEVVGVERDELRVVKITDDEAIQAVSDTEDTERASIIADIDGVMQDMEMLRLRALHRHLDADGDADGDGDE